MDDNPTFNLPAGGPYTTTLTFKASQFVTRTFEESPIQFARIAETGKIFTFKLHDNVEMQARLSVIEMPEDDDGVLAGATSLRAFIKTTVDYRATPFDWIDADGDLETVQYWAGIESLRETQQGRWAGEIVLYRSF